jgi:microcin C transport system substrate-binding protein
MKARTILFTIATSSSAIFSSATAQTARMGVHGLSIGGELKYGPDLGFEWVNAKAPKGGKLTVGDLGTFDSLNPFAAKNNADSLIKFLVFQRLNLHSFGDPFAVYNQLTVSMDVPADGMSITYHLNPKAKWSDGKPLTSKDVEFSFKILTSDKTPPLDRLYYGDVKGATIIDPQTIRFDFKVKNRELPLIMGELAVLPKHIYGVPGKDFIKQFANVKPIGSGPYTIKSFEFGRQVIYERNKSWWAVNEPFARGAYNFDEIHVKYYKDRSAQMEGFKARDFDFQIEMSSRAWAVDHVGEKWDKNWILKELWTHQQNEGGQGYAMNLRRPLFQDRQVRKALALAFDFDWSNETLFYKQYIASSSYFNNSEFNAKGLPDAKELALLEPLKDKLPPEVFTENKSALGVGLTGKQRLGEALKILKAAGWELKDGVMQNKKGERLEFTIVDDDAIMQRILDPYAQSLAKIGVKMNIKIEDSANYIKRMEKHDFDMTPSRLGQSESPGNEQRDYWHSSSAEAPESRNVSGINDSAIDVLVDKIIKAENRDDLVIATRALDRVLWFNYFQVPNFYMAAYRISYWNSLGISTTRPPYFDPSTMVFQYGWYDAEKAKKMDAAIKTNTKL